MHDGWTPLQSRETEDATEGLIDNVCSSVSCSHSSEVEVWRLPSWPRVLRLRCRSCPQEVLAKSFMGDTEVSDAERGLRYHLEKSNLEMLGRKESFQAQFRIPRVVACLDAPYYAVVEEYCTSDHLLVTIKRAICGPDDDLLRALRILAQFLVALHELPTDNIGRHHLRLLRRTPCYLHVIDGVSNLDGYGETARRLRSLQSEWIKNSFFRNSQQECLVHDGLTPLNLLYSSEKQQLFVTDFETMHLDTPFGDVGTVSAELKLSFAIHAKNPYAAEPYIGYFLREYFIQRNALDLTYRQFTWIQSYFMGRRLLVVSQGKWLDGPLRRWCVDAAHAMWAHKVRTCPSVSASLPDVRAVLFDFYNTLVSVEDDERDLSNFEEVRDVIAEEFPDVRVERLLSATQLRDTYFAEIQKIYEQSKEQYPDVDLEVVWSAVLGRPEGGVPTWRLYEDGRRRLRTILQVFRRCAIRRFEPFDGVLETLRSLKNHGFMLGVLSDAQPAYVESEIERAGIFPLLDCLLLSADFRYRKPDKRLFEMGLERLGVDPNQAAYVGDDLYCDIFGAQQAGMRTVYKPSQHGVAFYGNCTPDEVLRDFCLLPKLFGV